MTQMNPPPREPGLDEVVEAFETAYVRDGKADLAAFLPASDRDDYLEILCELIRVDMEFGRRYRRPTPLSAYRARFPDLFDNPALAREVTFEEARLRQQAEDNRIPLPTASRRRFGGDSGGWPSPPPPLQPEDDAPPARPLDGRDRPGDLTAVLRSPDTSRLEAETLESLVEVDLPAASRLARGLLSLPRTGDRFLNFHLKHELGRGAFGRVFLAEQEQMAGRPVALKVTADALGETQALSQLQHTNVVPIYSVHRDGPLQALCMPYFGSTTLADVIAGLDEGRKLPDSGQALLSSLDDRKARASSTTAAADPSSLPGRDESDPEIRTHPRTTVQIEHLRRSNYVGAILWLGLRLADGLAHAHERGILHRDLKPANVLFTDDGEPMLLDFNLASDLKLGLRGTSAMIGGTLPYMAKEHLEAFLGMDREIDARSDIFSLGVILFELLTGRHPYEVHRGPTGEVALKMIADRSGPVPDLRSKNPLVSPAVEAIVGRCLDPDPAHRYQKARHLVEDIQAQIDHQPLRHTPEPSVLERFSKWRRRHPRLTSTTSVAVGSMLLIAGLASGLLARQHRVERLEARESFERLASEVKTAGVLLGSPGDPPRKIEEGIALCRAATARYGAVDDPEWSARSLVASLPEADRPLVSRSIGELLGLWAQGETWRAAAANPEEKTERLARASRLLDRSEIIFGPSSVPAVLVLIRGEIARLSGRPADADRLGRQAAAIPPRNARERLALVPSWLELGRSREALALVEEALALDPKDASAWLLRGDCLARLARSAQAYDSYSIGISLEPGFDWSYFGRGMAALDARNFDRAVEDFDRLLSRRPDLLEARLNRALARLGLGDALGAVSDLDLVLENPEAPTRALFIRARAFDALGKAEMAAHDRGEGKRLTPKDELSWVTRGLARLGDGPALAIEDFDAALRINPRSIWSLQNKASVLSESLGRKEEAVRTLDLALSFHPELVPALAGRGVLLARLGRRDEALKDAKACLALSVSADTLYRVACVYALTSKTHPEDRAEALSLLSRAVRLDPAWLLQVGSDSDLDPLRDRPEFQRLIEALKLVIL